VLWLCQNRSCKNVCWIVGCQLNEKCWEYTNGVSDGKCPKSKEHFQEVRKRVYIYCILQTLASQVVKFRTITQSWVKKTMELLVKRQVPSWWICSPSGEWRSPQQAVPSQVPILEKDKSMSNSNKKIGTIWNFTNCLSFSNPKN